MDQTIVLDWDQTLVFSIPSSEIILYKGGLLQRREPDMIVGVEPNGREVETFVFMRPGLKDLLIELQGRYRLVLWTYSKTTYIESCLEQAGLPIAFDLVLSRSARSGQSIFKDLLQLGYPLDTIVSVDDQHARFGVLNPLNCIHILPWDGIDVFDDWLYQLPQVIEQKFYELQGVNEDELLRLRKEVLQQIEQNM